MTVGHPLRDRLTDRVAAGDEFCLTAMVVTETVFGFRMLRRASQNEREWAIWRPTLRFIDISETDALFAATLQVTLRRQGRQLGTIDALIAAVALRANRILLTTDKDFAPIPNLRTENWV